MMRRLSVFTAVALAATAALPAQELTAGKPAPALAIAKWVKGKPVTAFAKDTVYVVEFWATWCGPCIAGMPHLSAVQKQYGDKVTVIGVTSEDEHNSLADVEKMVKAKADTMAYTVAWDDGQQTHKAWFEAAGQEGIPCCFVVDKAGVIAWIGHPQWLDVVLPDVVSGKADVTALSDKMKAIEKRMMRVFLAAQLKPAKAIEEADALVKEFPFLRGQLDDGMFGLILETDDAKIAWPIGERMLATAIAANDTESLNSLAWAIVDPEAKRKERNFDLALKAAGKAVELTKAKDPNLLDTLARTHAGKGDFKKAAELQKQAMGLVGAEEKAQFEEALREYEAKAKEAPAEKKTDKK